jgi:hypothetical protein
LSLPQPINIIHFLSVDQPLFASCQLFTPFPNHLPFSQTLTLFCQSLQTLPPPPFSPVAHPVPFFASRSPRPLFASSSPVPFLPVAHPFPFLPDAPLLLPVAFASLCHAVTDAFPLIISATWPLLSSTNPFSVYMSISTYSSSSIPSPFNFYNFPIFPVANMSTVVSLPHSVLPSTLLPPPPPPPIIEETQ